MVANVQAMIRADRKITALKQLQVRTMKLILKMPSLNLAADKLRIQGHIWRTGFQNNEIEGVVFDDVPEALEKWHASGTKVTFTFVLFFCYLFSPLYISDLFTVYSFVFCYLCFCSLVVMEKSGRWQSFSFLL